MEKMKKPAVLASLTLAVLALYPALNKKAAAAPVLKARSVAAPYAPALRRLPIRPVSRAASPALASLSAASLRAPLAAHPAAALPAALAISPVAPAAWASVGRTFAASAQAASLGARVGKPSFVSDAPAVYDGSLARRSDRLDVPVVPNALGPLSPRANEVFVTVAEQKARRIRPLRMLRHARRDYGSRVTDATFLKLGRRLYVLTSGEDLWVRLFDAKTGNLVSKAHNEHGSWRGASWLAKIAAQAPDSSYVVTFGGMTLPVVYPDPGNLRRSQVLRAPEKFLGAAVAAFALDSKRFAVLSDRGEWLVWTRGTRGVFRAGKPTQLRPNERPFSGSGIAHAALSADGKWLMVATREQVMRYAMKDLKPGQKGVAERGWTAPWGGKVEALAGLPEGAVAFSHGAGELGFVAREGQRLYEGAWGSPLRALRSVQDRLIGVADSPESAVKVWSDARAALEARITFERDPESHYLSGHSGPHDPIHSSAVSPGGRYLVVGTDGGNLAVWDIAAGRLVATTRIKAGDIRALAFSSDGKYLATGAHLGDARIYAFESFLRAGRKKN